MAARVDCFSLVFCVLLFVCFFPHFHATAQQAFSQKGFGLFNLSTIPQTDDNRIKRSSGLFCVDRVYDQRVRDMKPFIDSVGLSLSDGLVLKNYFLQPSHIGKLHGKDISTDTAILLTIQKSFSEYELCFRSFAHLDRSARNIENNDMIVTWIDVNARPNVMGVTDTEFKSYGCIRVPIVSHERQPVKLLSLKHPTDIVTTQKLEFHYDAVWIEWNLDYSTICWEDTPALRDSHKPVTVQSLIVAPSTDITNGYLAGIVSFLWPEVEKKGAKGACVDIPFNSTFTGVPVTFATINMQSDLGNDSYSNWVDSAGMEGFRVCMAESFWELGTRSVGTPTFINFLAVERLVPENASVKVESLNVLRFDGLTYWRLPRRIFDNSRFRRLLQNFIVEAAELSASSNVDFAFIKQKRYSGRVVAAFSFQNITSTEYVRLQQKLANKFHNDLTRISFPTNRSSAEYKFFNSYVWSYNRNRMMTQFQALDSCEGAPVHYSACSTETCGIPGKQRVSVLGDDLGVCQLDSYEQSCNLFPCSDNYAAYGLNVDLSKNLVGFSEEGDGSVGVGVFIGIAIGGCILFAVIVGVILCFIRKEKSTYTGGKQGKTVPSVVLGKSLLTSENM